MHFILEEQQKILDYICDSNYLKKKFKVTSNPNEYVLRIGKREYTAIFFDRGIEVLLSDCGNTELSDEFADKISGGENMFESSSKEDGTPLTVEDIIKEMGEDGNWELFDDELDSDISRYEKLYHQLKAFSKNMSGVDDGILDLLLSSFNKYGY